MSSKLAKLAERLLEFSKVSNEGEIVDFLISSIEQKMKLEGISESGIAVFKIRTLVEKHYGLHKTELNNSYLLKDRKLTEPKFMWVIITLQLFHGNRKKTLKEIRNGLSRQKVYTCFKQWNNLSAFFSETDSNALKNTYKKILESYE